MIKINLVTEAPAAAVTKRKAPEISLGAHQAEIFLGVTFVIFLIVTGGIWWKLVGERDALKREQREKQAERDSLQQYIDLAKKLEAKRDNLQKRISVIQQLKDNQRGPVRIMDETSRALPDLVWLESLKLSGTTLVLGGQAMDENAIATFISNLRASPFFEEPTLNGYSRAERDTFNFSLSCVFTYSPASLEEEAGGASG